MSGPSPGGGPYDDTYYAEAMGKTGVALRSSLHTIISTQTKLTYDQVWDALEDTDQDPNNSANVIEIYSGKSISKTLEGGNPNDWNREHVWAKSHGDFGTATGPGTDVQHLRPEDVSVNGTRGNKDFDIGDTAVSECPGCFSDADSFEPRDAVKGDVARAQDLPTPTRLHEVEVLAVGRAVHGDGGDLVVAVVDRDLERDVGGPLRHTFSVARPADHLLGRHRVDDLVARVVDPDPDPGLGQGRMQGARHPLGVAVEPALPVVPHRRDDDVLLVHKRYSSLEPVLEPVAFPISSSRRCSCSRTCSGVSCERRRWSLAMTAPVAATPASPASPSNFQSFIDETPSMTGTELSLNRAVDLTRTGDLWLFRGRSAADQAIRVLTNAPVNHVGMAVVLDDMPPLMWHAELGKGLLDVWTGTHHRGVQLHDLRAAVEQWTGRYEQRAWLRQLDATIDSEMEAALLRTIASLDGTPFPATAALVGRWARGRVRRPAAAESTYCAEVVAATYSALGLLDDRRPTNYYDPGRFWSGDDLELERAARLGHEIRVLV